MKVPINFYCIGAQKAGTTTLHDILKNHPDIFLPERKEAPFFQDDLLYSKGVEWYTKEYFSDYKGERIVGSISPEFMYYEHVPERIFLTFGQDIKFVVLLRHPIDRAVSHYNMSTGRHLESRDFFTAIDEEDITIAQDHFHNKHYSYLSRGKYLEQINRYLNFFPRDNFLFLKFEDIITDQKSVIRRIESFLNIEHVDLEVGKKSNEAYEYSLKIIPRIEHHFPHMMRVMRNFLPTNFRSWVSRFYKRKKQNKFRIDKEKKEELFEEFFKKDIEDLKNITNIDFNG